MASRRIKNRKSKMAGQKSNRFRSKRPGRSLSVLAEELKMTQDPVTGTFQTKTSGTPVTPAVIKGVPIWKEHSERIQALEDRVGWLENRVAELMGPKGPRVDEIAELILNFLKQFPGVKFNTGTIGGNLGISSMKLSDKLTSMTTKGVIKREKLDGHSAMYWYEEPTDESGKDSNA